MDSYLGFIELFVVAMFACAWAILEWQGRRLDRKRDAERALDMAAAHISQRETFGKKLDERQAVQFMMAECASQLYIARLMLLHIAYKAEKGLDMRQENSIAKVYLAHMVHHVVDTAIQLGRRR
eukprot:gene2466-biopygen2088